MLGVRKYCSSALNLFDGFTNLITVIEIGSALSGVAENRFLSALKVSSP